MTSYFNMMKCQSFKLYNSTFRNFSYLDQQAKNSYIVKISSMDLYLGVIANSVIQNVTLIDSEFNFMLFQGFNAVSTLNQTD